MVVKRNAFGNLLNERRVFNCNRYPQTSTIRTNRSCTVGCSCRCTDLFDHFRSACAHSTVNDDEIALEIDGQFELELELLIEFFVCNCCNRFKLN